ncbi:hypothetical protein Y1Q_0021271 [Alligator mississippiensis]|uniref:Uncharacterized protein n=1 Tax=Alligator mississippiensis TaxID=8496 RepID=A0A151MS57_ALLMI|nr:hypothetical protein Y1Q_0021271 [Alligator mississippiensis]
MIQGQAMTHLRDGEAFCHLGTLTGHRARQMPEETINGIVQDAHKLDSYLLAPWQKIDVVNTFLIPCIAFILRGSAVPKTPLKKADTKIQRLLKKWLHLLLRASNEDDIQDFIKISIKLLFLFFLSIKCWDMCTDDGSK